MKNTKFINKNSFNNNRKKRLLNNVKKIRYKNNESSSNRVLFLNNNFKNNEIRKRFIKNNSRPTIFNRFKNQSNKTSLMNQEKKKLSETTDNELNSLSYYDAILKDKRTFFQFYFSLIRTKQILIFTFNCKNDFNSRMIKINFLFLLIVFNLFLNTAFFDDIVLHHIYILGGKISWFNFVPNILYTAVITIIIKNILIEFIFTEGNIISIKTADKSHKDDTIKSTFTSVKLKCILFYVLSIFITFFIWIYLACFFTVFKNSQLIVIKNSLISLGATMLFPFAFYMLPAILRIFSLESRETKNRLCLYVFSRIFEYLA